MEVKGVDHLEIAKHPYVHFLIFENLLAKMEEDLCLDAPCQAVEVEKQKQAGNIPHLLHIPHIPRIPDLPLHA